MRPPSNWFQLYDRKQADFQLSVNRSRMSAGEIYLWHNIDIMRKVIEESGLEEKLEQEYQKTLDSYNQNENERYQRYKSQIQENQQQMRQEP